MTNLLHPSESSRALFLPQSVPHDMKGCSFGDSNDDPRNASVTPQDINHLPGVDTNVAAKAARATQSEVSMTLL